MKVKATISFSGIISMSRGEVAECPEGWYSLFVSSYESTVRLNEAIEIVKQVDIPYL